ncbi:MAG: sulfatase-like hydrolase/transferase [Caldilineaceae bacterium]
MPTTTRPNILLLVTDQQRWDTVSAYGVNDVCRTPHVDAGGARGALRQCLYAHRHLLTGGVALHRVVSAQSRRYGERSFDSRRRRGVTDYLNPAGYRCGYAGKWHADEARTQPTRFHRQRLHGLRLPRFRGCCPAAIRRKTQRTQPYAEYLQERGFDLPTVSHRYVGTNPGCQTQEMFALHEGPVESCIEYFVAEETIRLIDELGGGDEPFFIWGNFWGPHTPCLVPEPYFSMYHPDDIAEHPSYRETFENKPYRQQLIERMWGLGDLGWRGFQEITARYYGHVTCSTTWWAALLNTCPRGDSWKTRSSSSPPITATAWAHTSSSKRASSCTTRSTASP